MTSPWRNVFARVLRRLGLAGLVLLAACGGESTAPKAGLQGEFVLQTVNGQSLPYTWNDASGGFYRLNSYRFSIIPSAPDLVASGGWLSSIDYAYTDRGSVVSVPDGGESGTWYYTERTQSVVLVSRDGTTSFSGTLDGTTLTLDDGGFTNNGGSNRFVFTRQ